MTAEQARLIKISWQRLTPMGDAVVASFYNRLFEQSPRIAQLFANADMAEQRRKFLLTLDEIVRMIETPDVLIGEVIASGKRHAGYGVHDEDYDDVGIALTWALGEALGGDFTTETRAAWREAYQMLAGVMKNAAHESRKAQQH